MPKKEELKKTLTPRNGAQALIRCLERANVTHMFGHPGGAAIPIFDALVDREIVSIRKGREEAIDQPRRVR